MADRRDDQRSLYADERGGEVHLPGQTFYEVGNQAGKVAADSLKVGWTLRRNDDSGAIVAAFAFLINPQGLTRGHGSRSQLQATQAHNYVDHFGPQAIPINLRQLVASGKDLGNGQGFYTAREDVQRFLTTIYLPATATDGPVKYKVYFHDNHFERGFEELVFFPPDSLTIERAVELHNTWRVELSMISLEKYPYDDVQVETVAPRTRQGKRYTVKRGDTLARIVAKLAGKHASSEKRKRIQTQVLDLNSFLRKKRALPGGKTGKPMKVYPGEIIRLPVVG